MIAISITLLIISFLLQGTISNIIGYTPNNISMFFTIYPLITLMILYPHFENRNKFLLLLAIFGILIDLVYSNTFIFNTCLFYIIYIMNKGFHFFFPYNLFTISISALLAVYTYHIVTFLFLILLNFDNYNFLMLGNSLINSTIMTIIYTIITYSIVNFLKQRFDLKEVK